MVEEQEDVQEQQLQEQEVPKPAGTPEELLESSRRRDSREGSVAGDTRGASFLRTSAQADESAADLGSVDQAGALGGEGEAQLAPPEVQEGLDVTPVPEGLEAPEVQQEVTREEPEVTVNEDSVLVRLWHWLVSCKKILHPRVPGRDRRDPGRE